MILASTAMVSASKLRPPSNFKVRSLGVNSFLLKWKDNSEDEDGFQIYATIGNGVPQPYQLIERPDTTQFVVNTNSIPGRTARFQLAAYRGAGADRKFSKLTSIVEAKAAEDAVFGPAENLKAVPINDSAIRLKWKDVSTSESGYIVEFRQGRGDWELLANIPVQRRYNQTISPVSPGARYSFRVTAFKGEFGNSRRLPVFSDPSNIATVKMPEFRGPTRLRVKADGEGLFSLRWKDNSDIEEGYEIQARIRKGKFETLGAVPPNTTATPPVEIELNARASVRIRAFRTVDGKTEYSDFSNVVTKRSLGLASPTDLEIVENTGESVSLTWKDNSEREEGYTLRYQRAGKGTPTIVNLPADSESHTVNGLEPGKDYLFQVRVFEGDDVSRYSSRTRGGTRDEFRGESDFSLTSGISFFEKVEFTRSKNLRKITVSGLPSGLTFDPDDLSIFGVVNEAGEYRATVRARFKGYSIRRQLTFRVIAREDLPEAVGTLADLVLNTGVRRNVDLAGKFRDPDVSLARRFTTNLGIFDIVLYKDATPLTVDNFLRYADGGSYLNTFFHRAPTGFVVQGGGFTYDGSAFGRVDKFAPVQNEPGISNLTGTVAMAKVGGDPNSATSQFFINLSDDNAPNLDSQNGGFTVLGRIAGDGMDLFDEIDALPKGNYPIDVGEGPISFGDVPVQADFPAPGDLNPDQLIRVSSVEASPILTFTASSLDEEVAGVTVSGQEIEVEAKSQGVARIRVRATDLDGSFVEQVFSVTVQ